MSHLLPVLQKPEGLREDARAESWFTQIAEQLFNGTNLLVNGQPHRFVEVEFYYHGDWHPDLFTHRDPLQRQCGRWYFHRSMGTYRSGSFKGLDLTFGDGDAFAGILIRGIEGPGNNLIDGPSLCVDHLLTTTGKADVASLDRAIGNRPAWEAGIPLQLVPAAPPRSQRLFRSARVGLSLKKAGKSSPLPRYVMRPYRYLSEPDRTAKGKVLLVLALHIQGHDEDSIRELTGCPCRTIERYVADFEAGKKVTDFAPYIGVELKPPDLCKLQGTWQAVWGTPAAPG
jgi:hypothetical protein